MSADNTPEVLSNPALKAEVERMAPWHLLVDINDEVNTLASSQEHTDGRETSLVSGKPLFDRLMGAIYPDGMQGKDFLDCACNCGGYSFWAKELGARNTFGFDVRDHWIDQAKFLQNHRTAADVSGMDFRVADLYDIPNQNIPDCDVTWFSGIFYHLPDPITGLKIAADKTKEVIYLNTAIITMTEEELGSGSMYLSFEGKEHLMSGVHNLNWFPSGPEVLKNILNWLGFPEVRVVMWKKRVRKDARPEHLRSNVGRVALLGAREKGMLDGIEDVQAIEQAQHHFVPPEVGREV